MLNMKKVESASKMNAIIIQNVHHTSMKCDCTTNIPQLLPTEINCSPSLR